MCVWLLLGEAEFAGVRSTGGVDTVQEGHQILTQSSDVTDYTHTH